ncbi:MAG: Sec-independent protein translocase protein TatB [Orrella sp.]|uniref:Sec-independent protein translocase protein TatB n=1 Tax=Orrella sp. TaxID=1921583 RepID=UPI003BEB59E9
MFDISFTELMLAGVVALIVIGPEKLPKVARTVGHLLGRAQRYVNDVKGDIQREVEIDELRKMKQEMESAAQSVQSSFTKTESEIRQGLQEPIDDMNSIGEGLKKDSLADSAESLKADAVGEVKNDTKDEFDYDYQPIMKPAAESLNGLGTVPASGAKVQAVSAASEDRPPKNETESQTASATSAAPQEPKT